MKLATFFKGRAMGMGAAILLATATAEAQPSLVFDHALLQTSLYTRHFEPEPDHNNNQQLVGLELHDPNRWFAGAAWFKNSYDQPTWYFYGGREFVLWSPSADASVRAKLSGGGIAWLQRRVPRQYSLQ